MNRSFATICAATTMLALSACAEEAPVETEEAVDVDVPVIPGDEVMVPPESMPPPPSPDGVAEALEAGPQPPVDAEADGETAE